MTTKKSSIHGQDALKKEVSKIFDIFKASDGVIKPNFILTGPSGSGKTFIISTLAEELDISYFEINAAQLTKEGTSGNSLSKALSPLAQKQHGLTVVFVDEFDKLFISGNSNTQLSHESTNGVQNEFLKVLEGNEASVFGDYGKYITVSTKKVLFVFAGAFNGEEDITLDRLRSFGIKTEFLGRVGLVYNALPLSLDTLYKIFDESPLLTTYLELFKDVERKAVIEVIKVYLSENYDKNTLGARMINTLISQYFIKGGLPKEESKKLTFQKTLTLEIT